MSAGARHGTTLSAIQAEFERLSGAGLFHFPKWYAEEMRALRSSMNGRFPITRGAQEHRLLASLRGRPKPNDP